METVMNSTKGSEMISPKIGDLYMLSENAKFESLNGGLIRIAGIEMSDEKQGEWSDGPHPYEDDPLIITVDALITTDHFGCNVVFENTNLEVLQVMWQDGQERWYKTDVSNLQRL
jgi:hypothetical protein